MQLDSLQLKLQGQNLLKIRTQTTPGKTIQINGKDIHMMDMKNEDSDPYCLACGLETGKRCAGCAELPVSARSVCQYIIVARSLLAARLLFTYPMQV